MAAATLAYCHKTPEGIDTCTVSYMLPQSKQTSRNFKPAEG